MELKDFIKTTMQSIIDATNELIEANKETGARINPVQRTASGQNVVWYYDGALPVTEVLFDVAITEGSTKSGKAGAGIEVLSAKIGAGGEMSASNENASRVEFSLRAALPATASPPEDQRFDGSKGKRETY